MHPTPEYQRPAQALIVEQMISNSRFITYLEPVLSIEAFKQRLSEIKTDHSQARHWCWAYIIGCPKNTTLLSMSDDGEPSGTAGKPMLNILNHSGYGDIAAIVVRYFGGTKLGTGGLVRAYSSSVQQALQEVTPQLVVASQRLALQMGYEHENWVRQWLAQNHLTLLENHYSHQVEIQIEVAQKNKSDLLKELIDRSQNQILFKEI